MSSSKSELIADGYAILISYEDLSVYDAERSRQISIPKNYTSKTKIFPGDRIRVYYSPETGVFFKVIENLPRIDVIAKFFWSAEKDLPAILTGTGETYYVYRANYTYFRVDAELQSGMEVQATVSMYSEYPLAYISRVIESPQSA